VLVGGFVGGFCGFWAGGGMMLAFCLARVALMVRHWTRAGCANGFWRPGSL
jgi:hypothetical protein